jgi:ATP-dependent DNA helicase RecQ
VDNLRSRGLDRALGLTGDIGGAEIRGKLYQLLQRGEYTFCYLAPERFQIVEFRTALRAMASHTPVAVIAIDEAHCVSEWGHDFRPAYLRIGRTTREVSTTGGRTPPLLALTGTASRSVLKDVQRELGVTDFDALVTPDTFNRAELSFVIQRCRSDEKMDFLDAHLKAALPAQLGVAFERLATSSGDDSYCGLVFCPHVNGPFGVTEVEGHLSRSLGIPSAAYSSTAPKNSDKREWGKTKRTIEKQFRRNEILALACTKGFGMGIDKPNIRYTVHFGFPGSIEAFYQEAGRAGRGEGLSAVCCLIASNDFPERNQEFLSVAANVEKVTSDLDGVDWDSADDVTRSLYFHTNSFAGVDAEVEVVNEVVQQLSPSDAAGRRTVDANELGLGKIERALHRLVVLGIVGDYTVDYSKKMLNVTLSGSHPESVVESYVAHVQTYQVRRAEQERVKLEALLDLPWQEFVLEAARLYTVFVYEVIERGRRRALAEMLGESHDGEDLRQRILHYLESTEYSEKLEALLTSKSSILDQVRPIADDMLSQNEAAELRGQVGRYLESYPDQPSLLVLRALAEARCRDVSWETVEDNIKGFVATATRNYGVENEDAITTLAFAIATVHRSNPDLAERLELETLERYGSDVAAPLLVAGAGEEVCLLSAWHVLNDLALRGLVAAGRDEVNVRP